MFERTRDLCTVAAFVAAAQAAGAEPHPGFRIDWDIWGSAHIIAPDDGAAAYANGWAQMASNGNAVLCLVAAVRAELAASTCDKTPSAALESDRRMLLLGIPDLGKSWVALQRPDGALRIGRFAAGMNDFAAAHPERIDPDIARILPVTAADILRRLASLTAAQFPAPAEETTPEIELWRAGGMKPGASGTENPQNRGSNAVAVAPLKSTGGDTLLMANPHLPWAPGFRWFEFETVLPDRRFNGVGLLGLPGHFIGFSDQLGWSQTVSQMHHRYYYELDLTATGYRLDGIDTPFGATRHQITVLGNDGVVRVETFLVRTSVFGPVVAERDGRALALWTIGRDAPFVLDQYHAMARATDLAAFTAAMARQEIPMFSTIYGDNVGHIAFFFGGRNLDESTGSDRRSILRDGTKRAAVPGKVIDFERLPQLTDPASGWLQSANDPPWTATLPRVLLPPDFPEGLVWSDFTNLRAQRILARLSAPGTMDATALTALKLDVTAELALRVLDDLLLAATQSNEPETRQGAQVLQAWDRTMSAGAAGAPLFFQWMMLMPGDDDIFATPFAADDPLAGPRGLADPAAAARVLGQAVRQVTALAGTPAIAWGDAFRLPGGSLPANGGPDPLGLIRATYFAPAPYGGFEAVGGDGYAAIVSFGPDTTATALLSTGNFTEAPPPGTRDQLELYANRHLRPVLQAPLDPSELTLSQTLATGAAESSAATETEGELQ